MKIILTKLIELKTWYFLNTYKTSDNTGWNLFFNLIQPLCQTQDRLNAESTYDKYVGWLVHFKSEKPFILL